MGSQANSHKQRNIYDILATQEDDESPEVMDTDTEEDEELVEVKAKIDGILHKYQKVMRPRDSVEEQSTVSKISVQAAKQPNSNKEFREVSPERAHKLTSQPTRLGSIFKSDRNNRVSKSVQEGKTSSKTASVVEQKLAMFSSKASKGQGAGGEVGPASNALGSVASGTGLGMTAVAENPRSPPDKGQTRPGTTLVGLPWRF